MQRGSAETFKVFVRNWWRHAGPGEPGYSRIAGVASALVPDPSARKTTIATHCTEEEAQAIARSWNRNHKPGLLSRKAEYTTENGS